LKLLRLVHTNVSKRSVLLADLDLENAEKGNERRHPERKQAAYVQQVNPYDESQPGFIDLRLSSRVRTSYAAGQIKKAISEGWLTSEIFDDSALSTPVITNVTLSAPINGDLTIDGSGLTSKSPDITAVMFSVQNVVIPIEVQLSQNEILNPPYSGAIGAAQIKFTVPITSTLGQILSNGMPVDVMVYSDKLISEPYSFTP